MAEKKNYTVRTPLSTFSPVGLVCEEISLTDQSFKDECDIDFIINNFVRTGQKPDSTMSYVDCTSVADYQTAMMTIAECNSNFEMLPAKIRDEFGGKVENYLAYISDSANLKDCYERGLIDKSTVDLKDVYPEKFVVQEQQIVEPSVVEKSVVTPQTETTGEKTVNANG